MIRMLARLAVPVVALCAGTAQAQLVPTTVTASGNFAGSLSSLTDGIVPANGSSYTEQSVYGLRRDGVHFHLRRQLFDRSDQRHR